MFGVMKENDITPVLKSHHNRDLYHYHGYDNAASSHGYCRPFSLRMMLSRRHLALPNAILVLTICVPSLIIIAVFIQILPKDEHFILSSGRNVMRKETAHITSPQKENYSSNVTEVNSFPSLTYSIPGLVGTQFSARERASKYLKLPSVAFVRLDRSTVGDLVFVTAASENHYSESLGCVASLQKHRPNSTLLYYDIGLTDYQATNISNLCDVTYRKFDFSQFPRHVRLLQTYAWKVIIIQELFNEFAGIFWMDTSVRLSTGDFTAVHWSLLAGGVGLLLPSSSTTSVFAATHPHMYMWLPTDRERLKRSTMLQATYMVMIKTEAFYKNVFYWLVLCALEEDCIAPEGAQKSCDLLDMNRYDIYGNCHRYDQSAINILINNYLNFDLSKVNGLQSVNVADVERVPTIYSKLNYC